MIVNRQITQKFRTTYSELPFRISGPSERLRQLFLALVHQFLPLSNFQWQNREDQRPEDEERLVRMVETVRVIKNYGVERFICPYPYVNSHF